MSYIIPVFISYAGCPHICAFCNQHRINKQMQFSVLEVDKQIDRYLSFLPKESSKEIAFYGGSFTGLPDALQEQLLDIAQKLRAENIIQKIRLSTRPDYIDEKVINRLLKYRVDMVELGVQSLDDAVLKSANRGHDSMSVFRASSLLQEAKIDLGIQLMLGLPEQSWESIVDTTKKVVTVAPAIVRIYPVLVFADTALADAFVAKKFVPIEIDEAVKQAAYMVEQFEQNDINVIRIGLQDDEGLREQGALLAGPYHPAFGELVASYRCLQMVISYLDNYTGGQDITISVPQKLLSQFIGHKKANVLYLKEKYPKYSISIVGTAGSVVEFACR